MADDVTHLLRLAVGRRERVVELACAEHPEPGRGERRRLVVQLAGCAAELPQSSLLLLAAAGVEVRVRADGCAHAADLERSAASVRAVLAACGADRDLLVVERPESRARRDVHQLGALPPLSRRQLLLLPHRVDVAAPEPGSTEHERSLFAIRQLAGGAIPAAVRVLPAPSAVLAAPGCTACGVCLRACPELALRIDRSETEFTLVESLQACIDCGQCIALCPEHVLARSGAATWGDVADGTTRELAQGPARTCERCRATFRPHGDEALCRTCAFRRANPFGSALHEQRTQER